MTTATPPRSEGTRRETPGVEARGSGATRARSARVATVVGWIGLFGFAAIAFELTCRVEDWVMYRMPIASPYVSIEDLLVHDADGVHGRRNARFEKWRMNNLGTRGPDAPVNPSPGSIRIIAVGASETFGLRESPDHEFPRQLEDSLNARVSRASCAGDDGGRPRFEVLNAAFAGMTIPTIEQDVRNRLRRFHPEVIVAYVSPSAYLEDQRPVAAAPDSSRRDDSPSIRRVFHPRSLDRLRDELKTMLPQVVLSWVRSGEIGAANRGRAAGWQFTSVPPERVSAFDADLRSLVGAIRSVGAKPLLVTHANVFVGRSGADNAKLLAWDKFYPRATGQTLIAFDSVARGVTLRVAGDSGISVADAAARLAVAPESAFADYMHFTDVGAALLASEATDGVLSVTRMANCGAR